MGFDPILIEEAVHAGKCFDLIIAIEYLTALPDSTPTTTFASSSPTPTRVSTSLSNNLPRELRECGNRTIAEALFNMGYEIREILEAIKRSSTIESALMFLHSSNSSSISSSSSNADSRLYSCGICMDDYPASDFFIINCCHDHKFCLTCISRLVRMALVPDAEDGGAAHLPACPHAAEGEVPCRHVLSEEEVHTIAKRAVELRVRNYVWPNYLVSSQSSSAQPLCDHHHHHHHNHPSSSSS